MADSTPSTSTSNPPSQHELTLPTTPTALLDLLVSLHLSLWPALSLAVSLYTSPAPSPSNPSPATTGSEVRDWFSGAISSMIQEGQIRDIDDLEEVLIQVVSDEFEVVIEDGSETTIARRIWRGAERLKSGVAEERNLVEEDIKRLWNVWWEKGGNKAKVDAKSLGKRIEVADDEQDTSDEEDDDEDDDEEMGDAPDLVEASERPRREKMEPEVDEDGFTKVVRGGKRR